MSNRGDLDRLTRRWRERHDARHAGSDLRPRANRGREALARRGFPYRTTAPADYVAEHGADMAGFTYDDESYADAELDAWLLEVGRLLRVGREAPDAEAETQKSPATKPRATRKPEVKEGDG